MNWFNNIKIRSKLLVVFGILVLVMISFAIFSVAEMVNIGRNNNELINSYQARQIFIADAIVDAYRLRYANLSRGYVVEAENAANMVSGILEDYERSIKSFRDNIAGFREMAMVDSGLTESEKYQRSVIISGIEDSFAKYVEATGGITTAVEGTDRLEVIRNIEATIPFGNDLSNRLQDLRDLAFFTTRRKVLEITDNTTRVINLISAIAVAFVLISALALYITIRNINRPLSNLENAVVEIANGNLSFPIRTERKDELGTLSNSIGDMVDKLSEHNKTMALMDNMDSMICVSDMDYNLLYVNKRLADRFGIDIDKSINRKCYAATRNKTEPCTFCQLNELLPMKNVYPSKDFQYIWDDTLNVWLGGTASIIRWVDGSMVLFQASRDVTQRKRQEELLKEALEAAKAASVAKSSFLANMSHEIRTPMNAILGIAEIQLMDDAIIPSTREALSKIHHSGGLLLGIINDILDLSKIEAGKLELAPAEYKVASLINDTVSLNIMRIGGKPIEFQLSVDEDIPTTMFGDELRIKQILNNLLSNAIKYTKEGVVKLLASVEAENEEDKSAKLVFRVADTGQGMSKEQVDKLFDEYSRFNAEANRTTEGTGLGMSITRNLLLLMNGEIFAESEVGKGSVVTIRLPQTIIGSDVLGRDVARGLEKFEENSANQVKGSQVVFEPMPYGKVLVTDDVESNLYVAKGLMAPYKLSVETVMSGFEAIDKVKAGNVYDIIFMDHMMPKMDGIETVKNIRALGYTQPIVALTANAVVGQSEVFLANGFNGFISKPIDVRQLNATLKKLIHDKQSPEVIAAAQQQSAEHAGGTQGADTATPSVDPKLAEIFVRDSRKALATLESLLGKSEDEDIQLYIINTHGMKSALANIGETTLSAVAAKLEKAGRDKNIKVMSEETSAFLTDLRKVIEKLDTPKDTGGEAMDENSDEVQSYLRDKLLAVKEACETFDKKAAKAVIAELREKALSGPTKELLAEIAEHLLNGDFEEVVSVAERVTGIKQA